MLTILKRILVGSPVKTSDSGHTLLPKWIALPVFCSDPLSSVAYATEQILLVLVAGGTAALTLTPRVGLAVVALLFVVVASYSRTVFAYPGGGGAYAVSRDNFGDNAALVAAAALMVDYVLTVAVSVTSGVANLISAVPSLNGYRMAMCLVIISVIMVMNLRGVRESGTAFAFPTYFFIGTVLLMLGLGAWRIFSGQGLVAETAHLVVHQSGENLQAASLILLLKAFASGCTALTGVEAISNGVPQFRKPKAKNASLTLIYMGALAIVMFGGVTWLAVASQAKIAEDPATLGLPSGYLQQTIIAQLGTAVFGASSLGFFALQFATTLVLVLAANTAFSSFPVLASVLGEDGFMPRQFRRRGDRLVFSNGIVILASISALLVWLYNASTTALVHLYILGVFVSFSLSQAGMVKHWHEKRKGGERLGVTGWTSLGINVIGASVTILVLIVVLVTKFTSGLWMVVLFVPFFVMVMKGTQRHYRWSDAIMAAPDRPLSLPSRVHAVVLVSKLNLPTLQAISFARATRPDDLIALHGQVDEQETEALREHWLRSKMPLPLVVLDVPYRDLTDALVNRLNDLHKENPRDIIAVFLPEIVTDQWWRAVLHNQSALRLKARLMFVRGVIVCDVPIRLEDDAADRAAAY